MAKRLPAIPPDKRTLPRRAISTRMSLGESAREFIMEALIIGGLVLFVLVIGTGNAFLLDKRNSTITDLESRLAATESERDIRQAGSDAAQQRINELTEIVASQSRELNALNRSVQDNVARIDRLCHENSELAGSAEHFAKRHVAFREASYHAVGQMVLSACGLVSKDPKEARDEMALDAIERFRKLNELDPKIDYDLVFFSVDEVALRAVLLDLLRHRNAAFTELVTKLSPEISQKLLLRMIPHPVSKTGPASAT